MTRSPHSIGQEQPLSVAHDVMRREQIRHLPVLHGGSLVGIVSSRDLHLVETLPDVDPDKITVEEAMSGSVYTTPPSSELRKVAAEMAEHKYGACVVMEGPDVVGVFTTVDAMRALADLLK